MLIESLPCKGVDHFLGSEPVFFFSYFQVKQENTDWLITKKKAAVS